MSDIDDAVYGPMDDSDLARRLVDRLLSRFFLQAGFDERFGAIALAECSIEQGSVDGRIVSLRLVLPLGVGNVESGWDGSPDDAFEIVDVTAETAARTIVIERSEGWPTGWERDETEDIRVGGPRRLRVARPRRQPRRFGWHPARTRDWRPTAIFTVDGHYAGFPGRVVTAIKRPASGFA